MLARLGRRVRASRGGFGRPQLAPWSAPSALTRRCGFGASAEPAEPSCAYEVLRVAPSATPAEIKTAFRRTARRLHPDAGPPSEADRRTDVFVKAVAAYEILSCERRRALYDAERRWTGDAANNAQGSPSDADAGAGSGAGEPWAFILKHSEVLREYGASVDALVPRGALRREIYAALGDALVGPELDVEAVAAGDAFPKFFEAEERGRGLGADLGVDLMHVVSGRTLLAAVRERVDAAIGEGRGYGGGRKISPSPSLLFPAEGEKNVEATEKKLTPAVSEQKLASFSSSATSSSRRRSKDLSPKDPAVSGSPPDAVLELAVRGRVVATAVRLQRGGEVVVYDAGFALPDIFKAHQKKTLSDEEERFFAKSETRRESRREASLLAANLNNYAGFTKDARSFSFADSGTDVRLSSDDDLTSDDVFQTFERRGPNGEAFTLTGLSGAFDVAAVLDCNGQKTHDVVAHATPGVTHLHWFCKRSGVVTGRATRAWMPPADLWLARPRSEQHAEGGWYFELPPGAPGERRVREALPRAPERRVEADGGSDGDSEWDGESRPSRSARRRDAFEEVRDDIRAMSAFFSSGFSRDAAEDGKKPKSPLPLPLPPAAALFATAFRALDRERGEDQGAAGAARRAWEGVFGKRY